MFSYLCTEIGSNGFYLVIACSQLFHWFFSVFRTVVFSFFSQNVFVFVNGSYLKVFWLTRALLSLPNYIVNDFAGRSSNNNCYNCCNNGCHFCDWELMSLTILYKTSACKLATYHYLFEDLYCCCTILQAETTTIVETTIVTAIILYTNLYIYLCSP